MKRFRIGHIVFTSMLMPFDGSGSSRYPQSYWRLSGNGIGVLIQGPQFPNTDDKEVHLLQLVLSLFGEEVTE